MKLTGIGARTGMHRGSAVPATWPNPITNKREMSMSSKPKGNGGTEPQATSARAEAGEVPVGNAVRTEEIRRRAYEIYLERGEQPGRDLDDWLQAERELERSVLRRAQTAS
jgi:hypothetical protein